MKTLQRLLCCTLLLGLSDSVMSADAGINTAGFLQRWLLLEPLKVDPRLMDSAVRETVEKAKLPGAATEVPKAGDTVKLQDSTLRWHAVKTSDYNFNLYHFAHGLGLPTSNVLFWTVTVVELPAALSNVRLAIGSNAASIWWVDGQEVISLFNDRQSVIDDGVSKRLNLTAGRHVIRAAIINGGGATDFTARFLDDSGKPVTAGVKVAL